MGKARGELLPRGLGAGRVSAEDEDAVAGLEVLARLGNPLVELCKQATEEIAQHGVDPDIVAAVRKAGDHFPAHFGGENSLKDFGVSAGLVEPADDGDVLAIGHQSPPSVLPFL